MDYLVCIYIVRIDNYYRAFMTHNPEIDAGFFFQQKTSLSRNRGSDDAGTRYMDLLTPLLPIGVADYILKSVFSQAEIMGQTINTPELKGALTTTNIWKGFFSRLFSPPRTYEKILSEKIQKIKALLNQIANSLEDNSLCFSDKAYPVRIAPDDLTESGVRLPDGGEAIMMALRGRILFYAELEKSLVEHHREIDYDLLNAVQNLALLGKVRILPSLGFTSPGEIICHRCGNTAKLAAGLKAPAVRAGLFYQNRCPICSFSVICCEQCNNLGESRLCRGLFAAGEDQFERVKPPTDQVIVKRRGAPSLTSAQARASQEIKVFLTDKSVHECLLWAATGAGKTEVILEAVSNTLNLGGLVLYASPRRDVVIEIAPRLEKAFDGVTISAVYGGSPKKFGSAGITAATAHQVIRFYKKFDLVIMDEVDAYPYRDNKMLHMAVRRAVKSEGKIVCLTATPSRAMLSEADKGNIRLVTIPGRYHGYPVPEPEFMEMSPFVKQGKSQMELAPRVRAILKGWIVDRKGQIFIFLPTVKMVQNYETVLEKAVREIFGKLEDGFISFSYAQDSLRDYKRDCFKKGSTRIFVTTSIMERGITVANAHVMVLNADFEDIFDEGTLIQMSGRAGRSAEYPHGGVVFVGKRMTGAMKGAREKIKRLNNEARKQGYLNPGW